MKLVYTIQGVQKEFELNNGSFIAGRNDTCDIVVKDASVSSQHLRLDVSGDKISFRDLLSRNGTFLNGAKVRDGSLGANDVIRLGKLEVRCVGQNAATAAASPAPVMHSETPAEGIEVAAPDDAYQVGPEETPPGGSFVPAVVQPEQESFNAVQVVKPGEGESYPLAVSESAQEGPTGKQKILWAAIAAIFVIALGIILMPPSEPTKNGGKTEKLDYWGTIREGEKAYRSGDFKNAAKVWGEIDPKWKKKYNSEIHAGSQLALCAQALEQGTSGDFENIKWADLSNRLKDLAAYGDWPNDRQEFAFEVAKRMEFEIKPKEIYDEAENLFRDKQYEEAKAKYVEIPPDSVYHQVVKERVDECDTQVLNVLKTEAITAGKLMKWSEAVEKAQAALAIKSDAELLANIPIWEKNKAQGALVRQFKTAIEKEEWTRAQSILPQIDKESPLSIGLTPFINELNGGLYDAKVQSAYSTWSLEELNNLKKDNYATRAKPADLFRKMKSLLNEKDAADKSLEDGDPFTVLERWKEMRRIEPLEAHPMNAYARRKMEGLTLEDIGKKLIETALKNFDKGDYRKGRLALKTAEDKCNLDVTKELKLFQDKGWGLYNQALNLLPQHRPLEAKIKMNEARDCYLPGEKRYTTIDNRYRKEFGE
ncbi:MAG: FHA domain-containing protein [Planctomycetes bacterium]|nr:FHA domain-containing protein [Planctomycetota bacterium]